MDFDVKYCGLETSAHHSICHNQCTSPILKDRTFSKTYTEALKELIVGSASQGIVTSARLREVSGPAQEIK